MTDALVLGDAEALHVFQAAFGSQPNYAEAESHFRALLAAAPPGHPVRAWLFHLVASVAGNPATLATILAMFVPGGAVVATPLAGLIASLVTAATANSAANSAAVTNTNAAPAATAVDPGNLP